MRRDKTNHLIDLIFPIAVFFVFAVSSLAVLVLAANIYENTTNTASRNFTTRTASAYIVEKVRQNDIYGQIEVIKEDGIDYLVFHHAKGSDTLAADSLAAPAYSIYIYAYEGQLREMRLAENMDPDPAFGTEIAPVAEFRPDIDDTGLMSFSFTFDDGEKSVIYAGERSSK